MRLIPSYVLQVMNELIYMWRGLIRNRIEWHYFFWSCFIRPTDLVELSQRQSLWANISSNSNIYSWSRFQNAFKNIKKNLFSVILGRIASDLSLPKCKLELKVKGNMLTSPYSVVHPIPTQNEWSQLLAKNDWNIIISFLKVSQICDILLNPAK